jgi:hypothetical protein
MCVEHFCGTKTRNSALLLENAGNTVGVVVVVGGVGVDVVVDVVLLLLWVLMLVWLPLVFLRSGFFSTTVRRTHLRKKTGTRHSCLNMMVTMLVLVLVLLLLLLLLLLISRIDF